MIGNTIGDYRILEKRGEGGMGMFFKAQDMRLDRLVGLKTIRAELLHEPEIMAKLEEEAKSLARLDHPNIARLLHYMVIGEQRYIVMEYVEGSDLAEMLRRQGPLSTDLLGGILPQVCAAIGYAHNRNVIHRDIKPSNILLTADNTVKVTDFGIAKILGVSTKTKTGVATGSLPYMAPEQIRGQGIDQRTDIYQLGVMLFELLTGRRPFLAETEYDMMSHHLSTPPPAPSAINPQIPNSADAVVLKAMAKDPAQRFASANELATAFRDAISGADDAKTIYRAEPGRAPVHRGGRKKIIGAVVIAILAVAAFVRVFWFSGTKETAAPPIAPLQVALQASLPPEVALSLIRSQRLLITHPETGTTESDTLRLVGNNFEGVFTMTPADSVRFILSAYDSSGQEVVRGQRWIYSKGQNSIQMDLRLLSLLPEVAAEVKPPVREDRTASESAPSKKTTETRPTTSVSTETNLIIDVQPFTERERVESIWVDGNLQTGGLPLKLDARAGLRVVRWQIGNDLWTDTVTVGGAPVEKNLIYEMSRGRVNIAVTFPDGPGFAEIWLDGRETGQGTPGELRDVPAGPHEIMLKRDGYRMQGGPQIVRVAGNDRSRVNIAMTPR